MREKVSEVLLFLMAFALPVGSIALPVKAKVIPLASVIAFLGAPFLGRKIRISPILTATWIFTLYVLIHSLVALLLDLHHTSAGVDLRVFAWVKQVISLLLGISVYAVVRNLDKRTYWLFLIGLALGFLTVCVVAFGEWNGNSWAYELRQALGLRVFHRRVSGLSLEPSRFAHFLTGIVMPFASWLLLGTPLKWAGFVFFVAASLLLVLTFSLAGAISALMLVVGLIILMRNKLKGWLKWTFIIIFGAFLFSQVAIPHNYLVRHIKYLLFQRELTVSAADRLYSAIGPFINLFSSYNTLGYGLGSSTLHLSEMIPEEMHTVIIQTKWADLPSLNSLLGRLLAETGLAGVLLFGAVLFTALRQAYNARKLPEQVRYLVKIGLLALYVNVLHSFFMGKASFAVPNIWLWLGIVDAGCHWHVKGAK
jgi:O-antigen ligase